MSLDAKRKAELETRIRAYVGMDVGERWVAPDGVNEAMIRHWCVVMGDENPVYRDPVAAEKSVHGGIVAPPAMLLTWVMPPYIPPWSLPGAEDEPQGVRDAASPEPRRHGVDPVTIAPAQPNAHTQKQHTNADTGFPRLRFEGAQ